jgi:hypothetical protein
MCYLLCCRVISQHTTNNEEVSPACALLRIFVHPLQSSLVPSSVVVYQDLHLFVFRMLAEKQTTCPPAHTQVTRTLAAVRNGGSTYSRSMPLLDRAAVFLAFG